MVSTFSGKPVFGYIGIKFKPCCFSYLNLSKFSIKSSSNYDSFYSAHKYIDPDWLTWFIGFTEGDGGLHTYGSYFIFGLTQKEEPVLQEIQSVLGFGRVYFDSSSNAYRYRVTAKSEILKLAILFNGRLATINKINQLKRWIDVLNAETSQVKLIFNPNPFLPTLKDSWLSGFTSAEGCFLVSILTQKKNKEVLDSEGNLGIRDTIFQVVRIKFVLEQKEESILLHIKTLFGVGNVQKTMNIGVFRYNLGSFKSNSVTVDYFTAYPLKGKKQSAFLKWKSVRDQLLEKKHLKPGGIELIRTAAAELNL